MPGPREVARAVVRRARWLAPLAMIAALLALRACVSVSPTDRLTRVRHGAKDPPRTTVYTGSLDVVRGGPIWFGFQGRGSHVWLDGVELAGTGCKFITEGTLCRLLAMHGPHALEFAAAPGARMVWNPVGRRGEPEYVQASSLSPDPPDSATFDDAPDTNYADGLIALAILLVVVGTLLALARARLVAVPRARWIAMAVVFVVAVAVRWIDLGGFGQGWDEDTNWDAGRNYVTNLLSLDFSDHAWTWNYEHPPVMKYLEGIGAQLGDSFGPARALSAIWVAVGCALMVPIGTRLFSQRAGLLAGGISALLPPLVAHGQIVGHEAPTVMWWPLGILLALSAHDGLTGVEPSSTAGRRTLAIRLAWVGVAIGVATASRFVNGLLGPVCVVIVIERAPAAWRRLTAIASLTLMPIVSVLTVYAIWPRLWFHPIDKIVESYGRLSATKTNEPFLGVMTTGPGPHYFILYLLATLPVGVLVGVIAGGVRLGGAPARKAGTTLLVAAWLLLPLAVMASPVRQDGVRYVLPSVLALVMMAAAGWDAIATRLETRWKPAFTATCAALAVYLAVVLVRVHPYYLDFFGEEIGGASTVATHKWFETAWWGEGLDRAVDYINNHAEPNAVVFRDCVEPNHLTWLREDLWAKLVGRQTQATWILWYAPDTRQCAIPRDAKLAYQVENDGLVLAQVWYRGPGDPGAD